VREFAQHLSQVGLWVRAARVLRFFKSAPHFAWQANEFYLFAELINPRRKNHLNIQL
jgi:hypothetical protein